jgi:hypothetical protein
VNVQLVVLLPPLEHAPDQIALRPFDTVNRTDVPTANDADPLLPVETLIPDGVEVIRSPLRPLPVTVRTAVDGGGGGGGAESGVTVNVAFFVTPFNIAAIVTGVLALGAVVEIVKTALWDPAATVTLDGTAATAPLPLASATVVAVSAAAERTTAPCAVDPPTTLAGLIARLVSVLDDDPGGVTVSVADRESPL